jgi:hypothetical protein
VPAQATIGRRSLARLGAGQGFCASARQSLYMSSQQSSSSQPAPASTLFQLLRERARPVSPCRSNRIFSIKLSRWAGGEQDAILVGFVARA